MDCVMKKMRLGQIEHTHAVLVTELARIDMRYLVPETVLTKAGVQALLRSDPIPVARIHQSFVALGESRLLSTARMHLPPSTRIPVLDCTGLDSAATEEMIWARSALHYLFLAHHPRGYSRATDVIRAGMPKTLCKRWCPELGSRRSFAQCIGVDRKTLSPPKDTEGPAKPDQSEAETSLDRIRKGVHGE